MRLRDLNPRWVIDADIVIDGQNVHDDTREGMGLSFDCPHCRKTRLAVFIANPVDGGPPSDDAKRLWLRRGATFDDLTLTPSIDASAHGHWHGFIAAGEAA